MNKMFLFFLIPSVAQANEIVYKPEASLPSIAGTVLVSLLAILLLTIFILKKKAFLPRSTESNKIKLIEKQRLALNTHVYLLEKEGIEYLMVDNGQHIAIQEVSGPPCKV